MGNLQWRIGDVTITRVVESEASIPPEGLLPAATAEGLARHHDWLAPHFLDDDGNLKLSIHALLVESQGQRIVVDTCVGNRVIPQFEGLRSDTPFLDYLADAGFARERVDRVICTHLHFDHVGWNLGDGKTPTFPNATYYAPEADFEFFSENLQANPQMAQVSPLKDLGRLHCLCTAYC